MKRKYRFDYFNLVKNDNSNYYKLETTRAQKKAIRDCYKNAVSVPFETTNDPAKVYAKFAQLLGANTKYFKSELSIALCCIFFESYKYEKTYHSAQKFIFNMSGKNLTRETALELFSNSKNKPGTISNFLDKKNSINVERNIKEFFSVFPYESISYDLLSILENEKKIAKRAMKKCL